MIAAQAVSAAALGRAFPHLTVELDVESCKFERGYTRAGSLGCATPG
jgi:hypothetical protein